MRSQVVPVTTDMLIVGGGIAGCNAAFAATERRAQVVVMDKGKIERRKRTANGSPMQGTLMSAGIVVPVDRIVRKEPLPLSFLPL